MNLKVRVKNPYFWVGVIGVIFSAMGINAETLTTWGAVWEQIVALFTNPCALGSVMLALLGVFVDPTTSGVGDSAIAMTYDAPKKG